MSTARQRSWPARAMLWAGRAVVLAVVLYLVGRAVVEVATVDPTRPATYRQDWGGPSYLGVLAVHAGPGVLVLVLSWSHLRRRAAFRAAAGTDRRTER